MRRATTRNQESAPMQPVLDLPHWLDLFALGKLRVQAREFVEERRRALPEEYPNEEAFEYHVKLMGPKPGI